MSKNTSAVKQLKTVIMINHASKNIKCH